MKAQTMAKGLRLTVTGREARDMLRVLDGEDCTRVDAATLAHMVATMRAALVQFDRAAAGKSVARSSARAEARQRDASTDHREVDGHRVWSTLGDYVDVSTNVDLTDWRDVHVIDAMHKASLGAAAPVQTEVRRGVWLVRVHNPRADDDSDGFQPMFLGGFECTSTGAREEIAEVAQRVIDERAALASVRVLGA